MAKITETRTKERIKQTGEIFTPTPLTEFHIIMDQKTFNSKLKAFTDQMDASQKRSIRTLIKENTYIRMCLLPEDKFLEEWLA